MRNGQLRVVGGTADLQVEVRGTLFDVFVKRNRDDRWDWIVRVTYDEQSEPLGDTEKTYAAAFRAAMRACDGSAPFRRYEAKP